MNTTPEIATSSRADFLIGARDAFGMPMLGVFASYLGFGALVQESSLSLAQGLFSTFSAWALPGQIILVELLSVGSSLLAIATAVLLANLRLLPMAASLFPVLNPSGKRHWYTYLLAHFVVITGWLFAMARCPTLPEAGRVPYFVGFSVPMWSSCLLATAIGFLLPGWVPTSVALGLLFLNPLYFMLILVLDLRKRLRVVALVLGAVLGPALHLFSADWGLMLTGLIAGTVAVVATRADRRHHP